MMTLSCSPANPPEKRFQAAIDSIRDCVEMGRFGEAVDEYWKLENAFNDELRKPEAFTHALDLSIDLMRNDAAIVLIVDFLQDIQNKYPGVDTAFSKEGKYKRFKEELIERVNERADEKMEALKMISYL